MRVIISVPLLDFRVIASWGPNRGQNPRAYEHRAQEHRARGLSPGHRPSHDDLRADLMFDDLQFSWAEACHAEHALRMITARGVQRVLHVPLMLVNFPDEVASMIGSLIGWIVFGLIVGAVARLLMPGRDPMGCLGTILLGVGGSLIGGFLVSLLLGAGREFQPASFLGSLLGALVLLFLGRRLGSRTRR